MRVILLALLFAMGMGTGGAVEAGAHWGWLLFAAGGSLLAFAVAVWCTRDHDPLGVFR